jgi:putative transposase
LQIMVGVVQRNRRLLEPIGNIPPAEAEERYYAMLEQPAMAA